MSKSPFESGFLRLAPRAKGDDKGTGPPDIAAGFHALSATVHASSSSGSALPAGVAHMSAGHTRIMRDAKRLKQEQDARAADSSSLASLGAAWNAEMGLRSGERIQSGGGESAAQPLQWNIEGVLKLAWKEVGPHAPRRKGPGGANETRRPLDALCSVAQAVCVRMRASLSTWLTELRAGGSLHINRFYDATPFRVHFGGLQEDLMQHARYLVPDNDSRSGFRAVAWDEFCKAYPRSKPFRGVVEVMAQNGSVHTSSPSGISDSRRVFMHPQILCHADASTTHSAVEAAIPELSLEGINAVAARLRVVTLSETPDNCSANMRKRGFTDSQLPRNVLSTPHGCCVHLTQRILCGTIGMKDMVGDVHAVFHVTRNPSSRNVLDRAVRRFVDENLVIIHGEPDPAWRAHTAAVLRHTLLRVADHAAGTVFRIPLGGEHAGEGDAEHSSSSKRALGAELILKFLNGDTRLRQLTHHENGCCGSVQEARDNVAAAILQGGLVGGFAATTPSTSRWGSMFESLGEQLAGEMCSSIIGQVFSHAFPGAAERAPPERDADDDDERIKIRRKIGRARECLQDKERMSFRAVMSWATEPIDHLWLHLQWLDVRGSVVLDLQHDALNPFSKCLADLSASLLAPLHESPLSVVIDHYDVLGDQRVERLIAEWHRLLVCMICQLHWRFSIRFRTWPYKLSLLVDARVSEEAKRQVATDLMHEPECCLDPGFGWKASLWVGKIRLDLQAKWV